MCASLQNSLILRRSCCLNYLRMVHCANLGDMHTHELKITFGLSSRRGAIADSLFVHYMAPPSPFVRAKFFPRSERLSCLHLRSNRRIRCLWALEVRLQLPS